jgi:probable F420-dependent oxidoreductase
MKFALTFGQLNPRYWHDVALEADRLGFESLWLPEHLVFPVEMAGQLVPGEEHPPVPPDTPVFEPGAYLSWIAAQTDQIRLGTFVYLLGIRHPFVGARTFATLDVLSGGRAEVGVGAGWMTTEWEAAGLSPKGRGRRLDEAIEVCRRLWTEETVEHAGDFWQFAPVMFEPKPIQSPHPPVLIGGESPRALRRAAELGDGWLGMFHTPETASAIVADLRVAEGQAGRDRPPVTTTVMGSVDETQPVSAWEDAGIDRLIVTPWRRGSEALDAMRSFAATHGP